MEHHEDKDGSRSSTEITTPFSNIIGVDSTFLAGVSNMSIQILLS